MKRNLFFPNKWMGYLVIPVAIAIVSGNFSCSNQGTKVAPTKENCITLSWSQVNSWLSPGWSNPTDDNYIPRFYFESFQPMFSPISVDAYPQHADGSFRQSQKQSLTVPTLVPPCSFNGLLPYAQYYNFYLHKNQFDDGNGGLKSFGFIRLVPVAYTPDPTVLQYEVYIVTVVGGAETATYAGKSWPCPPYCCPSRCPTEE